MNVNDPSVIEALDDVIDLVESVVEKGSSPVQAFYTVRLMIHFDCGISNSVACTKDELRAFRTREFVVNAISRHQPLNDDDRDMAQFFADRLYERFEIDIDELDI